MLNSSPDSIKAAKINECIMRRRARNLRAKVKALLPVQTCCKHDNRNRCVHEIEDNRRTWQKFSNKRKWTTNQQKQNSYYYEKNCSFDNQERFQKLTDAEIEQIKEDKLYYLGQDNIQNFQDYLRRKQKQFDPNKSPFQLLINAFLNYQVTKNKDSGQHDTNYKHKKSIHSLTESDFSLITTHKVKKATVDDRLKQFQERRKVLQYEEKSKRLMNKVKLNMRLERAEVKLEQLKWKKMSELELKKDLMENQLQKISNKRKNNEKKGEIKSLQEQLRRTFLTRTSKTANQQSHTARIQMSGLS